MELTPEEKLALKKIERQELQWQKWKKVNVALSIVMVLLGIWFMNLLGTIPESFKDRMDMQAIIYAVAIPKLYFFCGMTGLLIGMTIKHWKGNPDRILLLGILKRLEKNESEPVDADNPGNPPVNSKNQLAD